LDLDAVSLLELHARADEINLKLVDLSRLEHFGLLETVAVAGAHDALGHLTWVRELVIGVDDQDDVHRI